MSDQSSRQRAAAAGPHWWSLLLGRRRLLGGAAGLTTAATAAAAGAALGPGASPAAALAPPRQPVPGPGAPPMFWLGRDWFCSRPGDWLSRDGRIEQIAPRESRQTRVVNRLTDTVRAGPARIRVRTGTLQRGRGFSGILLGTGTRGLDRRARALIGPASGQGGGLIISFDSDGRVRVRDHRREARRRADGLLAVDSMAHPVLATGSPGPRRRSDEDVLLDVRLRRAAGRRRTVVVTASDARTGRTLSRLKTRLPRAATVGGLGLVSSELAGSGARHWFADFSARGRGVARRPGEGLGPIVSTRFTTSQGRLRLTAQMAPLDPAYAGAVRLERVSGGVWETVATSTVTAGFIARFDVPWDVSRAFFYRVSLEGLAGPGSTYVGTVPREPDGGRLRVASISCTMPCHRRVDGMTLGRFGFDPLLPGEKKMGLYTPENLWFPHTGAVAGITAHKPDLVVAHGDQFYEFVPYGAEEENSDLLDVMGRWLLWCWAFADVTRHTPTVVLIDDHDVYHPNIWGEGGVRQLGDRAEDGGFRRSIDWVNALLRMQCGHNPPPASDVAIGDGLRTYYTDFAYGGVDFAVLEDRTFKSAPRDGRDDATLEMLGETQEQFLADWIARTDGPRLVLSQTVYASIQTDADGKAMPDRDSGGWPGAARRRAIDILAGSGALMLAGDQHMGSLVRHLHPEGGPWQFSAPSISATFQRWFEPGGRRDLPRRWTDAFGNDVLVQAVVQPDLSRRTYTDAYGAGGVWGQRTFTNDGYGIVDIDAAARTAVVAAWAHGTDPSAPGARPYPGFPFTVPLRP